MKVKLLALESLDKLALLFGHSWQRKEVSYFTSVNPI